MESLALAASPLLRRATAPDAEGQLNGVTPALAGWAYLGFETFTPAGNWSGWPPHKHDTDDPPIHATEEPS